MQYKISNQLNQNNMNEEKLDKEIEQLKKEVEQLEKRIQNIDDFELNDLKEFLVMFEELKKKIHEEMKKRGYFN